MRGAQGAGGARRERPLVQMTEDGNPEIARAMQGVAKAAKRVKGEGVGS